MIKMTKEKIYKLPKFKPIRLVTEKLEIVQWGKNRSLVKKTHTDTKEETVLLLDNNYLMSLDEMGLIK